MTLNWYLRFVFIYYQFIDKIVYSVFKFFKKLAPETLERLEIRQSKARYVPMHLHAYRLILPEFIKNQNIFITANLPLHFVNTLKRLKLKFF